MSHRNCKKRLTGVGCWGVVLVVSMASFGLFFYGIHYYYDVSATAYEAQDMANLAAQAGRIAAILWGAAMASGVFAIAGIVMVWTGREKYIADAQTDMRLPSRGLRDLCSAA